MTSVASNEPKQLWHVRCERMLFGSSCIEFEMVFTNREDAKRVYEKGERASVEVPSLHWMMGMMIANDVEYAEHDIDNLVKEFLGEED